MCMTKRWRAEPPLSHYREAQSSPGSCPGSLPRDSSHHPRTGRNGHCHLRKMWGQVSVPLCFLGATGNMSSLLVKLKSCSSPPAFAEPSTTSIQEITWALLHTWAYITLHVSSTAFLPWKTNIHHTGRSPNNTVQALSLCRM